MMKLKALVIVFAVIIIILLCVLFFYKPVKGPTISPTAPTSASTTTPVN
jgi:uncharacterized protein YqfA (UPF0365 family)